MLAYIVETIFFFRIPMVVLRKLPDHRGTQRRHVPGRRVVVLVRQAGRIHEMAVGHAELLGIMVHQTGESLFLVSQSNLDSKQQTSISLYLGASPPYCTKVQCTKVQLIFLIYKNIH